MYPSTYEGKNDAGEALAGTVKSYDTSNWKGQTYLVSWYGRANYSLLDRYLLTFTARYKAMNFHVVVDSGTVNLMTTLPVESVKS